MRLKQPKIVAVATVTLIMAFFFIYGSQLGVNAQAPRVPGVTIDDWFKYEVEAYLNSTDENATFPEDYILLGESVLTEISVSNVSASNVTYTMTYHLKNGSQVSKQYWVDVDSGNGTLNMIFIAANLTLNDPIYTSPEYESIIIDSNYYFVYAGGFREVVGLHRTEEIIDAGLHGHETLIFTWDRAKGALLEFNYQLYLINSTYTYNATINAQIMETNAWKRKLIGIYRDDWIKYINLNFTIETTLSLPLLPEFLLLYNQTEWLINRVLSVNDTLNYI